MKKFLATFLFITGLSTQVYAHDVIMRCDVREGFGPDAVSHFKYVDRPLIMDKAYARVEGKWEDLCEGVRSTLTLRNTKITRRKSSYSDNAAVCNVEFSAGKKHKYIFDFETKTFRKLYHEVAINMPGRVVEEELGALDKFYNKYGIKPDKLKPNNVDVTKKKSQKKKEYNWWGFPIKDQADEDDIYRLSFKRKCE